MSDIASQANLSPAVSQLPVSWYFDEKIFELEKRLLFDAGPGYVGHELMVPEPNQFRSLEWLDHSKLLINRDDGFTDVQHLPPSPGGDDAGRAWPIATSCARFTAGPTTPTAC
jgi:hypothetical protein